MSATDRAGSPPLLTAAVPGFRAWALGSDGRLRAAAWDRHYWSEGINVAACARGGGHVAPHGDCTCGLYAFHTVHRQLSSELFIGAVAAWGAMEVHVDGFRAERACVLALGRRDGMRPAELRALQRASQYYRVPIVPRSVLQAVGGLQTAAPSAAVLDLKGPAAMQWHAQRRGYVPGDQIWAEPSGGVVTLGITAHARRLLGDRVKLNVCSGDRLDRAQHLTLDGDAVQVELPVAAAGIVVAVNDAIGVATGDRTDPDGAAWVVRVVPSRWQEDAADLRWGSSGHAATLATAQHEGGHVMDHLRPDVRRLVGPVGSWRDVQQALRADRSSGAAPRYASAAALYDDLVLALGCALESDNAARSRLTRLDTVVAFDVSDPSARLTFDLRPGQGTLACGPRGVLPALEVACSGNDLGALLEGRLDLGRDTRTRRLRVTGSPAAALSALAVLTAWTRRVLNDSAGGHPIPSTRKVAW